MQKYLKILVEDIHSTTVATIGADGHPQTRVIDIMLYDEKGVYFLTAKGKVFYEENEESSTGNGFRYSNFTGWMRWKQHNYYSRYQGSR